MRDEAVGAWGEIIIIGQDFEETCALHVSFQLGRSGTIDVTLERAVAARDFGEDLKNLKLGAVVGWRPGRSGWVELFGWW